MTNQGRIISIVVAVVIGAGIVFFGLQQFKKWHDAKLQAAVEKEQEKFAEQAAVLLERLEKMEREKAANAPAEIPEERIAEVFGDASVADPVEMASGEKDCGQLEQKIRAFFDYLDRKGGVATDSGGSHAVFNRMMKDLSEHPPVVVGETRDIISLLHNQAHFFRTLDPDRIQLVLNILKTEKDVLEPTLALFYEYYTSDECLASRDGAYPDPVALYAYAGFFLNTLSGKSYLMRRDSAIGSLTRYYSLLVLDHSNDIGANKYGLDIRPHIELAFDDIQSQNNLSLKGEYIEKLQQLSDKYRIPPAAQGPESADPQPAF